MWYILFYKSTIPLGSIYNEHSYSLSSTAHVMIQRVHRQGWIRFFVYDRIIYILLGNSEDSLIILFYFNLF